jgi:hypothetical protein
LDQLVHRHYGLLTVGMEHLKNAKIRL